MPRPAEAPPGAIEEPPSLVEAAVEDPRWTAALGEDGPEALARQAAAMALEGAGVAPEGWSASFLFADDEAIADLNGRFRGKPSATNVLSWPAFDLSPEISGAAPEAPEPDEGPWSDEPGSLGDVALAYETCAREAEARGLPLRAHALHLALHGTLHLLGYDHERDADAQLMEGLERRLLVAAGEPDPYVEEDQPAPAGPARTVRSDGR